MNKDNINFVLYHGNCNDGLVAAYFAYLYYDKNKLIIPTFIPVFYGRYPPQLPVNSNVLIVDFSFRRNILEQMMSTLNILILDHHKTAQIDLEGLENCIFDLTKSGAVLSYEYFFGSDRQSLFLQYIQDHDLWTEKFDNSHSFATWFHMKTSGIELIDNFQLIGHLLSDEYMERCILESTCVGEFINSQVENAIKHVRIKMVVVNNVYYIVAFLNCTENISLVGNKLCEKYKYINLAAIYNINNDIITWSLRSTNDASDASVVASYFGGGGHRNACGMKTKLSDHSDGIYFGDMVIDNVFFFQLDNMNPQFVNNTIYIDIKRDYFDQLIPWLKSNRNDKLTNRAWLFNRYSTDYMCICCMACSPIDSCSTTSSSLTSSSTNSFNSLNSSSSLNLSNSTTFCNRGDPVIIMYYFYDLNLVQYGSMSRKAIKC